MITVALKAADGTPVTDPVGTVQLTTTIGSMSPVADGGNGSFTATLTSSTASGTAMVTAKLDGASLIDNADVTFTAGPAAAMTIANASSNGQTGVVGKPVTNLPSVKVADAHGNGVPGIEVTFAVASGGGSITGSSQTTNATGVATVGGWTLGSVAGANTITARVTTPSAVAGAGFTAELIVTFTATGIADVAGSIVLNAGDAQTAVAGTAVSVAPSVRVVDGNNNPVSGVSVAFSVATGGGTLTGANTTTNASGVATIGGWTLGNAAGANTITASTPGVSGIVTITATGIAGPAASIAVANAAANGQTAVAGTAVAIPPAVRVTDSRGNNVAGIAVTFAVATGGGSVTGASATTNASGIATAGSWILGAAAGANTLTASSGTLSGSPVTFTATGTAGAIGAVTIVAGDAQTAIAGAAVAVTPSVKVADANGNPVVGAQVTFTPTLGDGTVTGATATTNASGIATAGSWTLGTTAGVNRLAATSGAVTPAVFTATAVAGPAARMTLQAGGNQSAPIGTAVAVAPSVRITDANNNVVAGVSVAFAVATGGGTVSDATPVTNTDGVAAVGTWTLGAVPGANTLTATSGSLTGSPVTFTATALAGAPGNVVKFAGDAQTAVAGSNVAVAPSVRVTTSNGLPLQGISVTFSVTTGGGSVTSAVAATNDNGVAAVGSWKLGNTAGSNSLTATVASLAPVTFTATGSAGSAAAIAINGGNNQSATVGTAVPTPPSAKVTDANGNIVPGAGVTFSVTAGGGSITGGTATTSSAGIATVGSWTLGPTAGANTLTATLNGVSGASVSFAATGANIPPLSVALTGRRERGQTLTVTVTQSGSPLAPSAYTLTLEPADLGQVNSDGTVKLLKTGDLKVTATAGASSGNTTITVARPPLVVFDMFRDGTRQIWQVAIDGGDLVKLTSLGSENLRPSQVGDRLVYASARDAQAFNLWSMAVSTGVETQLTATSFAESDPHLSSDGARITFISQSTGLGRAMYANVDGSGVAPVAATISEGAVEALPAWSPGSDRIVFSSTATGLIDLYVTTTLGGIPTKLGAPGNSSSAEVSAAWGPDDKIAFLTNRNGVNEIWITDSDGSPATLLTEGSSPTWLPDGRIVFSRGSASTGALYWVDPANPGVVTPIATATGGALRPSAVRP